MGTDATSQTAGREGAEKTVDIGMSIDERAMRSLEAIEFYLSELVYYSRADRRVGDSPEKRHDYSRHLSEQLVDYNGFQAARIGTDSGEG